MSTSRAAHRYQAMDIQSMSPPDLIVFLYSTLLAQLHKAKQAMETQEFEARDASMAKALAAIEELIHGLDCEVGGNFADNMAALYAFWCKELVAIDLTSDATRVDRLISMVAPLHKAWSQAAATVGASGASTAPHDA